MRDGLIYLQYNPYGTNEINVLIYDTAENKVVLNEKNLDCSASIPRDDSSHVVLLEKDGKTALFNMLDKTFSGWDKPEMDPDESLGWDDIKESIVGSDIVFLINGVFYNGSFQKIAQMNEFYRRSNVSVTKKWKFCFLDQ